MKVNINRQLAGLEDLLFGVGTVDQDRQGTTVTVTKINASNLPFDDLNTLAEVMAPINEQVIPNLAEILLAGDNAVIATDAAAAALVSETNTASLYDQFDDRYLGNKVVEPTLDNDGNVLLVGALYWDTIITRLRVWDGVSWGDALELTATSTSTVINKTLDSITNQIGADHIHYKVRNASGSTIPINTVVTASGTQPGTDYILVIPITDPQTQIAIGIVHTTLANNGTGLVINTGIADDVDTSLWPVGTILYPSTAGDFTTVKPTIGRYQACALVLRQHATQGTLLCEFTNPEQIASTAQEGYVQLNDTLTSTSTTEALTAAQGKVLQDNIDLKAPLASPAFTDIPEAPTAAVGTDTTQLATTAFVNAEIANDAVLLVGDQTVDDIKTFTSSPIVPTPTTPTQASNAGYSDSQVAKGSYMTYGGTADAVTLTTLYGSPQTAYAIGQQFRFRAIATNTGAMTIDVDGLGVKTVLDIRNIATVAGEIRTDVDTIVTYDGTNFIVDRQIERGSNANGEYVKFADGTLIQRSGEKTEVSKAITIDTGLGSFRSSGPDQTLPTAFINTQFTLSGTVHTPAGITVSSTNPSSASSVNFGFLSVSSTTQTVKYSWVAVGRWK